MCKINRDSVWKALRELEARKLLIRGKRFRNSNDYTLQIPVGGKEGPTQIGESAEKDGQQSAESDGRVSAESKGRQSAEKDGRKGYPRKVPQGRVSSEGVVHAATHSPMWPSKIPQNEADAIATEQNMTPEGVQTAYREFRQPKIAYNDAAPPDSADVWEAFRGWLRSSKQAKAVRTRQAQRSSADVLRVEQVPPECWQEYAATSDRFKVYATGSWESVANFDRAALIEGAIKWKQEHEPRDGSRQSDSVSLHEDNDTCKAEAREG